LSILPARTPYYAYRAGATIARFVPDAIGAPVARSVAQLAPAVMASRRAQVERNLRRVHGADYGGAALRHDVAATFDSYGRYFFELFRLPSYSKAWIDTHFVCHGIDQVRAAIDDGRGAILALPHLGNWDFAGAWLAGQGFTVTVVAEPLEPRELYEWFVSTRARLGMRVIPLSPTAGTEVLRALRANEVVCLLSDRDIQGGGIEVDFFGERTTLPGGPATLSLRTGAPVVPTAVYFAAGREGHHAVIRPPVPVERHGSLRDDVQRITQLLATELELLIRAAPEQWHLFQPNWPSDPGYGD
jgi:KDO2-lipid IV(A) lauroyltransferase